MSEAMDEEARAAVSLFQCWWAMVEAEADLCGEPIKDDKVCLHFSGSGASCMVLARHLRKITQLMAGIKLDEGIAGRLLELCQENENLKNEIAALREGNAE